MNYNKPPLTINDQILLLESRGLNIPNKRLAAHFLSNISYYRLSAYMKSFQRYGDQNHTFMPFAKFERIIDLYSFDRDLRLVLLDAIERIEVAFRCSFVYEYSMRLGNNWYESAANFSRGHARSMSIIQTEINSSSEIFITHYKNTYANPANPPSFMVLEILSFGKLSILYKNTVISDAKKAVAKHFGVHHTVLESWLEHLVYIRNICAHHSRIWNRDLLINKPVIPTHPIDQWTNLQPSRPDKLYTTLILLVYMLKRINPTSSFTGRLRALLHRHPMVNTHVMGFPVNWLKDPFWQEVYIPWNQHLRISAFKVRAIFTKKSFAISGRRLVQH